MTLCFLLRGTPPREVLLGYKKRGFGAGKQVGIGGHVEAGETVVAAACRELYEETGVTVAEADLRPMGSVTFRFPSRPAWGGTVHAFVATQWVGEPGESDELRPAWYPIDAVPYGRMWDDSGYWLPQVLAGRPVVAEITFADDNATVCDAWFAPPD